MNKIQNLDRQTDRAGFLKQLYSHKLLCSILISIVISTIFSVVYQFHFSSYSNDDYNISLLISNGDYNTFYVNSFFSYILVLLQSQFKTINCFVCFQYLGCFASMIVFNYIFLKKLNGFIGFITSVSISSLIFVTDILLVQYSQTAVALCVAGVVLGYAACTMESKKSYRVWQILCSMLLIVVSSMIRIAPFLVSMAFSVLFVFCLIIQRLAKNKSNNLKNKIVFGCRKSLSLILIVLVSLSMSVGFYWLAGLVLPTDKDSLDYNAARTAVVDYRILPYEGNESFYSDVGINSDIELSMIGFDKEQYNTQMLKRIAEHSEQVLYGEKPKIVFAAYSVFDRAINSAKKLYRMVNHIKNACGLKINDRLFSVIILFLCLLFISVAIIVIRAFLKNYNIKL